MIFLLLNQNMCCGYSKQPSQRDGSFENPKHNVKLMGKKTIQVHAKKCVLLTDVRQYVVHQVVSSCSGGRYVSN